MHGPALDVGANGFTVDAWIQPDGSGLSGHRPIVWKSASAPDPIDGYGFYLDQGKLSFALQTIGPLLDCQAPAAVPRGQWTFAAATAQVLSAGEDLKDSFRVTAVW